MPAGNGAKLSKEERCPLNDLPTGSPTTGVQLQTREVPRWPEKAGGGVQLMAVPGLVLVCL